MGGVITNTVGLTVVVELKARDDLMRDIKNEINRCEFILRRYALPKEHPDHRDSIWTPKRMLILLRRLQWLRN